MTSGESESLMLRLAGAPFFAILAAYLAAVLVVVVFLNAVSAPIALVLLALAAAAFVVAVVWWMRVNRPAARAED